MQIKFAIEIQNVNAVATQLAQLHPRAMAPAQPWTALTAAGAKAWRGR